MFFCAATLGIDSSSRYLELKSIEIAIVRIQNRGSRFVLVTNEDCEENIEYQIARNLFQEFPNNPS